MNQNRIRSMITAGVLIAMGILLPMVLHSIPNAGSIFLPMHIPVLLAGLLLSWPWALAVGILTPVLSSLLTGMPPMAPVPMAVIMTFELATYAMVTSLLARLVKGDRPWTVLYALVPAMVAGRLVAGLVVWVLVGLVGIQMKTPWLFMSGGFVTGLPGLAIQIVILPTLYYLLHRALGKQLAA